MTLEMEENGYTKSEVLKRDVQVNSKLIEHQVVARGYVDDDISSYL
jgi:hypothetical protein